MNTLYDPALILTVRMDEQAQLYFDRMRNMRFPSERNFLKAHLTIFHKLPNAEETLRIVQSVASAQFEMRVAGLINLGAGIAFRVESDVLTSVSSSLALTFADQLSAQDRQGFRAHVTICNKIRPEIANQLLLELSAGVSLLMWRHWDWIFGNTWKAPVNTKRFPGSGSFGCV